MREFDHDGLLLAEYQGKLFEKSVELNCSTANFIRRFYLSELLKSLDYNSSATVSLWVPDGIEWLESQFGEFSYGTKKLPMASLFWIGWMYRYISYTREQPTQFVMKVFDYKQMNSIYYSFHTQSPEWVVSSLLDIIGEDERIFDNNYRLKKAMKQSGLY